MATGIGHMYVKVLCYGADSRKMQRWKTMYVDGACNVTGMGEGNGQNQRQRERGRGRGDG